VVKGARFFHRGFEGGGVGGLPGVLLAGWSSAERRHPSTKVSSKNLLKIKSKNRFERSNDRD